MVEALFRHGARHYLFLIKGGSGLGVNEQDFENTEVEDEEWAKTQEGGKERKGRGWLQISSMNSTVASVADPDPHHFGKLDPESVKLDPVPHQSEKVELGRKP